MREIIRVSELSEWLKCRRRAYLHYEMGYDKDADFFRIGRVFHAYMNSYYTGQPWTDEDIATQHELFEDDAQMVEAMYATYVTEVEEEGLDVGQTTVAGEKRYQMEIGGLTLTGQIDRLYHDVELGGVVVQDTKTVGRKTATSPRDFQLMTYAVMAREEGHDVVAIEHNKVTKNKRTARAKPPYIDRSRFGVTPQALDSHKAQLEYHVNQYRDAHAPGTTVESPWIWAKGTNDCSYQCPFFEMCDMIDDGEDYAAVLETEYRRAAPIDFT